MNQLGNSLESLPLDKNGDGGKSRPTTSGSVGIASDYGSRPSTGDGTLKNDSRPPTRDDAIMDFGDSLTMFQTRPGTADTDFYESETQSRPGTSGSMTFSRPVTREGEDQSRPSTRENFVQNDNYDQFSEYYNESEDGRSSRPGTSGSLNNFPRRPGTADSTEWLEEQHMRPSTSDTFRRPDTADRFRSDFRPDSADTFGNLSRPGTTELFYDQRPGTSETFRRPSTADIARTGVRPGTADSFYTDEASSVSSRPQTAVTIRPIEQQQRPDKKLSRPVTAAMDGHKDVSNNLDPSTNIANRKKPVGILKKRRPQTAVAKSHIPMDVVVDAKRSVDNKKMRPRTAKFNLNGKPPLGDRDLHRPLQG